MRGLRQMLAGLVFLILAVAAARAAPPADGGPAPTEFRRGVNIIGYDPIWDDPAKARFKKRHFAAIRRGGFAFVRVNLFAFKHMDARNRIDPKWLERLDWVVREATRAGLG